jgi:double-stranded uracil-DNA glycosylase
LLSKEKTMIDCFPPIATPDAKILILGSFPGKESLRKQEYYAHPRNSFWFIIRKLFRLEEDLSYPAGVKALESHGVALWDVLSSCRRKGSLDSDIDDTTILVNDFPSFFRKYTCIKMVFFNGMKAEKEYRRRVLPSVDPLRTPLYYHRLPSTSPAMARLNRDQKLAQWAKIIEQLD